MREFTLLAALVEELTDILALIDVQRYENKRSVDTEQTHINVTDRELFAFNQRLDAASEPECDCLMCKETRAANWRKKQNSIIDALTEVADEHNISLKEILERLGGIVR